MWGRGESTCLVGGSGGIGGRRFKSGWCYQFSSLQEVRDTLQSSEFVKGFLRS